MIVAPAASVPIAIPIASTAAVRQRRLTRFLASLMTSPLELTAFARAFDQCRN
jgi:hypothetical protein